MRKMGALFAALSLAAFEILPSAALARWAMDIPTLGSRPGILTRCDRYYPFKDATELKEGNTTLSVLVSKNGAITSSMVVISSGNTDLDSAARTCVSNIKINAFKFHEQPFDAVVEISVAWRYSQPSFLEIASSSENAKVCHHLLTWPPPPAIFNGVIAPTILFLDIGTDGIVTKVTMTHSSGWAELDDFIISCYEDAVFPRVATSDGTPAAYNWQVMVRWTDFLP